MAQIQKKFIADAAVDENKIASSAISSTGALDGGSGTKISVKVDGSTIDKNGSNQIEVKAGGITNTQVSASAAIVYSKLDLAASVKASDMDSQAATAGQVLTADGAGAASYTSLPAAASGHSEQITLSGTDITNQYVDLAVAVQGASASDNSISLSVKGGPVQLKAVDYTVALTGGTAGVTRITLAGDLATGGAAALVATDVLIVNYQA